MTVTVAVAVVEHPAVVPVTVKVEVAAGETVAEPESVGVAPALQVYVVAPVAVSVTVVPAHIVTELTVTVGSDEIATTIVARGFYY